jgi:hypothetical protein
MRKQVDADTASEDNAGRYMHVCPNSAIVLDDCPAVDNAVFADHRTSIDDNSGHHYRASSNAC